MYYIGIDVGGTTVKAGVVSETGHIIYKAANPTVIGDEVSFINGIADLIEVILKGANLQISDIQRIGVGCPGGVDAEEGVVVCAGNLGLKNFPLRTKLEKAISAPILVNNDANCAALGEYHALRDRDISSFVMVTLGTGVGGGIIINKKLYTGYAGLAGEFGGMIISQEEKGNWEHFASASALVRAAEKAAYENHKSVLFSLIQQNGGKANGEIIFQALRCNDKVTETVFRDYIRYLGDGIISILYSLRPQVIAIGGGLSQAEELLEPLKKHVAENSNWLKRKKHTQICKAVLGNDAGIVGAALLKDYT